MVKEKPKAQSILESIIADAVDKLIAADPGCLIGQLNIQLDMPTGEIQIYDAQEILIEKNIIFDWAERSDKGVRSVKQALYTIRGALVGLKFARFFDNPVFIRPFKVSLVDDNFEEIETIFTLEEPEFFNEGRLMKNLEQDLQNFSRKLFADIE